MQLPEYFKLYFFIYKYEHNKTCKHIFNSKSFKRTIHLNIVNETLITNLHFCGINQSTFIYFIVANNTKLGKPLEDLK